MITDFVKDGKAHYRCEECGQEMMILKYELSPVYDFPVINNEKTIDGIHAFHTKHGLCHKIVTQLELGVDKEA